jgi:predicted nucleic acid-binding protein
VNIVVVDASVIVKWVVPQKNDENDVQQALVLLEYFKTQRLEIWQPPIGWRRLGR